MAPIIPLVPRGTKQAKINFGTRSAVSKPSTKSKHVIPTKSYDHFNADSLTGHQTGNICSKPSFYFQSRQAKINKQLKNDTHHLFSIAAAGSNPSNLRPKPSKIFENCRIYLSGCYKDVTDHLLRTEIPYHGGVVLSFDPTATHIIVADDHAGGVFAAGKIDKQLAKKNTNGPKYVRAQWVLDSIKNGKRMMEGNYMPMGGAVRDAGQMSVVEMFKKQ